MDTHPSSNGTTEPPALSDEAEDLLRRLRAGELIPPPAPEPSAPGAAEARRPRPHRPLRRALAERLPPTVRGAALDPAMRGALGLGLVALVAALAALGLAWRSAPRPLAASGPPVVTASAPAVGALSAAGTSALGTAPASVAGASAPSASTAPALVVDVAGKVRHPGVVSLPAGARVADAVQQAGGVLPGTDTSALSLARKLVDGEQILVTGTPGTAPPAAAAASTGDGSAPAPGASSGDAATAPSAPLDLNSASVDQLDGLPGVGPVLAGRIVEYRTAHNGFTSVGQLREVKGLGGKTGEQLMPLVRVG